MLLTPKQVAERLAVSPRTVYLWLEEGRLPAVRLSERVTRVPSEAVDALIAESTQPAVSEAAASGAGRSSVAAETPAIYGVAHRATATTAKTRSDELWSLVQLHRREILALAYENRAENVRVFGSVVRGGAGPDSDVDFLVDAGAGMTLLDQAHLVTELEDLLGVRVDVAVSRALKGRVAAMALADARPL